MWTPSLLFMLRLMQSLIQPGGGLPSSGVLHSVWCGLYQQGTPPPTPQTPNSGIIEANYDGYSRQAVVWFPPWLSTGGPELLAAQDVLFVPTDSLVPNLITGVVLYDAFYGGNWLLAAPLAVPGVSLGGPTQAIKVQPQYSQQFAQLYGGPEVVS